MWDRAWSYAIQYGIKTYTAAIAVISVCLTLTAVLLYQILKTSRRHHGPEVEITLEELARLWKADLPERVKQKQTEQSLPPASTQKEKASKAQSTTRKEPTAAENKEKPKAEKQPSQKELKLEKQPPQESREETVTFKHEQLQTLWNAWVDPYKDDIGVAKYYKSIKEIAKILDEKGSCPSVVMDKTRIEVEPESSMYMEGAYEELAKVSLLEHSINVAEIMIDLLRQENVEITYKLGSVLVTALGHDLGKIPDFYRSKFGQDYKKYGHPVLSAEIVNKILPDDIPDKEDIIKAIKSHHWGSGGSELAKLLKEADRRAREKEASAYKLTTTEMAIASKASAERKQDKVKQQVEKEIEKADQIDLSWLDANDLKKILTKYVNTLTGKSSSFYGFTYMGVVFIMPWAISEAVKFLSFKHGIKEIGAMTMTIEKRRILERAIIRKLHREHNCILTMETSNWGIIPEKYTARKYVLYFKGGTAMKPRKGVFTPIVGDFFRNYEELENKRLNHTLLRYLERIEPLEQEE